MRVTSSGSLTSQANDLSLLLQQKREQLEAVLLEHAQLKVRQDTLLSSCAQAQAAVLAGASVQQSHDLQTDARESCATPWTATRSATGEQHHADFSAIEDALKRVLREDESHATCVSAAAPAVAAVPSSSSQLSATGIPNLQKERVARNEHQISTMLRYLDISEASLKRLYTNQLLEALSAQSWQVHLLCSMTEQQQLQELSHWLEQMSLGLPHYDKPIELQPTPGWFARNTVDEAVDGCVKATLAWGLLDRPCRLLQLLMLNIQNGQRCGSYAPGWQQQVAVAVNLTADQRAVVRQAWLRVKAARAALLRHHDQVAAQLAILHEQYASDMEHFEQALHLQFARSKSPTLVQKQQENPDAQWAVSSAGWPQWHVAAACQQQQLEQQQQQQLRPTVQQQGAQQALRTSLLPGYLHVLGNVSATLTPMLEERPHPPPPPGEVRRPAVPATCTAGGTDQCTLPPEQQQQIAPQAAAAQQIKATVQTSMPPAVGAAASAKLLTLDQELLLTVNSQQQQELEGQMAAVKGQLSVLYADQTMTLYNTLSKKQLAVAFVHSYPLLLDTFAICDAFDLLEWGNNPTSS